jgi:hypothetical protein
MSLQLAAQHLAAKGRGPDDQLVHMSGKEVAGLQALAKAAGGSLTVNPKTGLAEAGFLDNLLPTIVGAGITYFSGGTIDPLTAAAMVGGVETARTGDIGKGALAGLGGFGGASMVGGLAGGAVPAGSGTAGFQNAVGAGASDFLSNPSVAGLGGWKAIGAAAAPAIVGALQPKPKTPDDTHPQMIRPYKYEYNAQTPTNMVSAQYQPAGQDTSERQWFNPQYTALPPYRAANGGIIALADGGMAAGRGPVERMSNNAAVGANTMYPMANMSTSAFATPYQTPQSTNMMQNMAPSGGGTVDQMSGEPNMQGTRLAMGGAVPRYGFGGFLGDAVSDIGSNLGHMFKGGDSNGWAQLEKAMGPQRPTQEANSHQYNFDPQTGQYSQQMAMGGITNLGGYSDGGRLLRGPGDGVSDSIPAQIGNKQPARLADGEFVVPARIVSELGNGSTEAGARQLYKMMDRVQQARGKTTAKGKVAKNTNAAKALPA